MRYERAARLRLDGFSRDSYRNPSEADAMTQELSSKIVSIAHARTGASVIGASTKCCARSSPM